MSTVVGYGTDYDYDDDYIYYVLPQSVTYEVEISPDYTVNDWGTEEFLGTEIPCTAQMLYSQNLRDKLRTDVLTISTQTPALTSSELGSVYSNLHLSSFHLSGTITSFPFTIEDERISARSSVVNVVLGTPASVTSDLSWSTNEGIVTFTGALASSSSTTIEFDIAPTITALGTDIIVDGTNMIVQETQQVSIPINQDFFYINAKTGYHLISAMFTSSWGGRWDTIIGISWTGYNYALFLHAPYTTSARTENVMLVWVKNS